MRFTIDNLSNANYLSRMSKQNLAVLKTEIEKKIQVLNTDLETINKALEIQNRYSNAKPEDFHSGLESIGDGTFPTPEEIEKVILTMPGEYQADDVPAFVQKAFPLKQPCSKNAINTALHQLIKWGKLQYVRERIGRRPAIYARTKN